MHRLRRKLEPYFGPRWPRKVRLALALLIVALGYICWRWRLTSAHGFMLIGFAIIAGVLLIRRILFKRSQRANLTPHT